MTPSQSLAKRSFDLFASLFGLFFLLLPGLILLILVKTTSRGPALFIHPRIGRHGNLFNCIKFRTMYSDSEKNGSITTAIDLRITPVGRILRKFKLDELPQLWNVFIGKMSFVGPRPDVPGYADMLTGENRKILELRPGITGPATLHYRNEEELLAAVDNPKEYNDNVIWPQKVKLNLYYYYHWSFLKDLYYIAATILPTSPCSLGED